MKPADKDIQAIFLIDSFKESLMTLRMIADDLSEISRKLDKDVYFAVKDVQDEMVSLEATSALFFCRTPTVINQTETRDDVIPADRLITLAGPGHRKPPKKEEEKDTEFILLRKSLVKILSTSTSIEVLMSGLSGLGCDPFLTSNRKGVVIDGKGTTDIVLMRKMDRWVVPGLEISTSEIASKVAGLALMPDTIKN